MHIHGNPSGATTTVPSLLIQSQKGKNSLAHYGLNELCFNSAHPNQKFWLQVVLNLKPRDHVTPAVRELHWL